VTVDIRTRTGTTELSGHEDCQITLPLSGPKLNSNLLIDTDNSSTKTLAIYSNNIADGDLFNDKS